MQSNILSYNMFLLSGCLKALPHKRLKSWKPWCAISKVSLRKVSVHIYFSFYVTLICLYNTDIYYFLLFCFSEPSGLVTFTRKRLDKPLNWKRWVTDTVLKENNIRVCVVCQLLLPQIKRFTDTNNNWKTICSLCFSSKTLLTNLHITCEGTIEDNGYGMLQVRGEFTFRKTTW